MTHLSPRAIEAATQRIYENKGGRKGVNYIGWEFEPEEVKAQWREDVSVSVVAYLTALEAEGMVVVPSTPTLAMIDAGSECNPTQWNDNTDPGFAADVANDVYRAMVKAATLPQPPRHKEG